MSFIVKQKEESSPPRDDNKSYISGKSKMTF
jgi:hypothetical protein